MLGAGKKEEPLKCGEQCGQPIEADKMIFAAYAHFLADQHRDLHFINEKQHGKRRTYIQTVSKNEINSRPAPVTDDEVKKFIGSNCTLGIGLLGFPNREIRDEIMSRVTQLITVVTTDLVRKA